MIMLIIRDWYSDFNALLTRTVAMGLFFMIVLCNVSF